MQVTVSQEAEHAKQSVCAMKVQAPACPWEFYICKALQGRVAPAMQAMFLDATRLYLSPASSVMLTPYGQHGTLQDLLNAHLKAGKVSTNPSST